MRLESGETALRPALQLQFRTKTGSPRGNAYLQTTENSGWKSTKPHIKRAFSSPKKTLLHMFFRRVCRLILQHSPCKYSAFLVNPTGIIACQYLAAHLQQVPQGIDRLTQLSTMGAEDIQRRALAL